MRVIAGAVLALLSFVVAAVAAPPARPEFDSPNRILAWMEDYHLSPKPQRVPEVVHAMRQHGVLKDPDTSGLFVGFIAGVLSDNQADAPALVARMFPLPPEDQGALIRAIAYSGLPDWKELMEGVAERMPARRVLMDRFFTGKEPLLFAVKLDSGPAVLDTLWGYYLATRRFEPVVRVMTALPWAKEKASLDKLTAGAMAKWTLAAAAVRDKDLLDLYRVELKHQGKDVAGELKEVVTAAETFEHYKLRKAALKAIEEMKIRNPTGEATSAWAKAGKVGSVLLALGCVAANVAGHPEIGAPCIVSGAALQGAQYLWQEFK